MNSLIGDYPRILRASHWESEHVLTMGSTIGRMNSKPAATKDMNSRRLTPVPSVPNTGPGACATAIPRWKTRRDRTDPRGSTALQSSGSLGSTPTPAPTPRTGCAVSSCCSSNTPPRTGYLPRRTHPPRTAGERRANAACSFLDRHQLGWWSPVLRPDADDPLHYPANDSENCSYGPYLVY